MTTDATPRARLFVALDLPAEARERLLAWGARALPEIPGLRLQRPEVMHLTLCFLGEQPAGEQDAIEAAVRSAVGVRASLRLTPAAPLWLPARRPRVAAVELSDDTGGLGVLQADVADVLARGGWYQPEHRRFLAHVTVARIGRSGSGGRGGTRAVPELGRSGPRQVPELGPPPSRPFTAAAVSLYRSHLGGRGARYEPLATIALLGAEPEVGDYR